MIFKDITLSDASTEAKVEVLGAVLDTKFTELQDSVNSIEKQIGPQGQKGDKGDKGEQGVPGVAGKDGVNGRDGVNGKDGKDGLDGEDGLEAPRIVNAEVAIDDTLLLTLSDGSEIKTTKTIVGPKGAGGMNGAQGPQGLQGPQGDQGIQGETGATGAQGPQGIQGVKGDTGDTGPQGIQGIQGIQGVKGDTGDTGPAGATGAAGVGVPVGGTTGQVLAKIDATNYNTQWITPASGGGVSSFNTRTGAVTLTSSDVTTALTYTPYDAANPNGYTSNLGTVTSVTGTAPVVSSGGTTPAISMAQATSLVSGYLSSTDWTTFNNKQPAGTYATGTGTASGTNTGDETNATIKTKLGAATSLVDGYLTSTDWSTFNNKQPAGTYATGTGTASGTNTGDETNATIKTKLGAATSLVDGYLTSTDWNTFNNKGNGTVTSVAALTLGTTGTDLSSTVATSTTTPVITLNVPTASAANRGALSSTDWSIFNGKQAALVSGTNIKTINGSTVLGSGDLVVTGSFTGGTLTSQLKLATGTASAGTAPLEFVAGIVNTTAEAGAIEYDGNAFYSSVANSTRGVIPSEQIVVLTGNNTLTSQTAAQPLFDGGGGPAGGAVTLPVGTYLYETSFCITGMSATSGSFGFAFGGTSTETFSYSAQAAKAGTSLTTPMAMFSTCGSAAITTLVANSTGTVGQAVIRGVVRITVAGTLIPQISLTVAAAAVIQANGYFKITPVGNATVATVGNWT